MQYSTEEAAAFITQVSQDNLFDLYDDGNGNFPVGSGSNIGSETEEEYTESNTTDEDELEQNVFGTGPIPKRRRGCQTRGGIRGSINVCLVKDVELNCHKMSDLKLNHHKVSDQLLHELLKKEKAVELRTVILVVMKKIITDGLRK